MLAGAWYSGLQAQGNKQLKIYLTSDQQWEENYLKISQWLGGLLHVWLVESQQTFTIKLHTQSQNELMSLKPWNPAWVITQKKALEQKNFLHSWDLTTLHALNKLELKDKTKQEIPPLSRWFQKSHCISVRCCKEKNIKIKASPERRQNTSELRRVVV